MRTFRHMCAVRHTSLCTIACPGRHTRSHKSWGRTTSSRAIHTKPLRGIMQGWRKKYVQCAHKEAEHTPPVRRAGTANTHTLRIGLIVGKTNSFPARVGKDVTFSKSIIFQAQKSTDAPHPKHHIPFWPTTPPPPIVCNHLTQKNERRNQHVCTKEIAILEI